MNIAFKHHYTPIDKIVLISLLSVHASCHFVFHNKISRIILFLRGRICMVWHHCDVIQCSQHSTAQVTMLLQPISMDHSTLIPCPFIYTPFIIIIIIATMLSQLYSFMCTSSGFTPNKSKILLVFVQTIELIKNDDDNNKCWRAHSFYGYFELLLAPQNHTMFYFSKNSINILIVIL